MYYIPSLFCHDQVSFITINRATFPLLSSIKCRRFQMSIGTTLFASRSVSCALSHKCPNPAFTLASNVSAGFNLTGSLQITPEHHLVVPSLSAGNRLSVLEDLWPLPIDCAIAVFIANAFVFECRVFVISGLECLCCSLCRLGDESRFGSMWRAVSWSGLARIAKKISNINSLKHSRPWRPRPQCPTSMKKNAISIVDIYWMMP